MRTNCVFSNNWKINIWEKDLSSEIDIVCEILMFQGGENYSSEWYFSIHLWLSHCSITWYKSGTAILNYVWLILITTVELRMTCFVFFANVDVDLQFNYQSKDKVILQYIINWLVLVKIITSIDFSALIGDCYMVQFSVI